MLIDQEATPRSEHPTCLRQRLQRVGHRAQHEAEHHHVDAARWQRQSLRRAGGDRHRHRGDTGCDKSCRAQRGIGLHCGHAGDGGRVVGEVQALPGADLADRSGSAGEQLGPVLSTASGIHTGCEPG